MSRHAALNAMDAYDPGCSYCVPNLANLTQLKEAINRGYRRFCARRGLDSKEESLRNQIDTSLRAGMNRKRHAERMAKLNPPNENI
jgi:hypothetical protein